MFNTLNNTLAKCPHCRQVSSVGRHFARTRATIFFVLSLVLLLVGIGITVGTMKAVQTTPILYALWGGVYLVALLLFLRFIYYVMMKISKVEGPL
jgi:phosphatidylinositol-4,5-bisphosphate 4-phosphatase